MNTRRDFVRAMAGATAMASVLPGSLRAQERFPNRPIRLLIPFAPGGQTDILGRRYAARLGNLLGQSVVIENKGGAGGSIVSSEVARSRPDGYTLLIATSSTHAINPMEMARRPYDPVKDFSPIAMLALSPLVVVVNPDVPAHSLHELIALVRAHPGKYAYGSAGVGSITHLTGELLKRRVAGGMEMAHVPYKGSGQSVQDALGGQIPILMATFSAVLQYHKAGRLRVLAVAAEKRSSAAPEVPTAIEAGVPDMLAATANWLCGPPALPAAVVATLGETTRKVMDDPAFRKELEDLVIDPVMDSSPEKTARFLQADIARFTPIIKATGVKLE